MIPIIHKLKYKKPFYLTFLLVNALLELVQGSTLSKTRPSEK